MGDGLAAIRLPAGWRGKEIPALLKKVKGLDEAWIVDGEFFLRGADPVRTLHQLKRALLLLQALGVPDEMDFMDLLRATPSFLVDELPPGVDFTLEDGRPRLGGDVQWLQCVIADLAHCAAFLACSIFLCLEPQAQWKLLTDHPSTFDTLVARIEDDDDRALLQAFFESGLSAEMRMVEGDPERIAVWLARCPSWAEAALLDLWLAPECDPAKRFWLATCPALRDIVPEFVRPEGGALAVDATRDIEATLGLPDGTPAAELLRIVVRMKGVEAAEIAGDTLRLRGPRATRVRDKLMEATLMLEALTVSDTEDRVRVLAGTPALMVDPLPPGVESGQRNGRARLDGDVQWLQCLIADLAHCAPSLACLVFLCMRPPARWTLLTRYPATFDVLLAHLEDEVNQESMQVFFEAEFRSQLKETGDPERLAVLIARCPRWAEESLFHIWSKWDSQPVKKWWLATCPALGEALARWTLSRSFLGKHLPGPQGKREEWVARYQPDAILERLRVETYPPEGGRAWRTGVRYIRYQFHEILRGTRGWQRRYGNALEACRCLRPEHHATLSIASALVVLSVSLKHDTATTKAMAWLLHKLYANFTRYFSTVAFHSLVHGVERPETRQLCLDWDETGRLVEIDFDQAEHMRQVLGGMIALCGAEAEFQSRLPLKEEVKQRLIVLANSREHVCLNWLAPNGLGAAPWKIQFLWRVDFLRERKAQRADVAQTTDVLTFIFKNALLQERGAIPGKDLNDLAQFLIGDVDLAGLKALLEGDPSNRDFTAFMLRLVAKGADAAYLARKAATGLIAVLCGSTVLSVADLDAAAQSMTTPMAITKAEIRKLQRRLLDDKDAFGWERVFLWASSLLKLGPPDPAGTGPAAETADYLLAVFKRHKFKDLTEGERAGVRLVLVKYSPQLVKRAPT